MVSMARDIKIPVGFTLMAVIGGEVPTAEGIKELIFAVALPEEDEPNVDVLKGLIRAYMALFDAEAEENNWEPGYEVLNDANDYEAEKVYRRFAVKGWRVAVKREYPKAVASRDDDEVYDCCPWYDFGKMVWPDQLVAEVGYLAGYREGVAMTEYVQQMDVEHGKDWWKNPELREEF